MQINDFKPNKIMAATDSMKDVIIIYGIASLIVATLFSIMEGETWTASLYWTGITATSIGYGDISPKTGMGRALAYVWAHLAIFGIAPLIIVRYMEKIMDQRDNFTHEEQVQILGMVTEIHKHLLDPETKPN